MQIKSLTETIKTISDNPGDESIRKIAATQGMLVHSQSLISNTEYFNDTLSVLDGLSLAKAQIDKASWHDITIAQITSSILFEAQKFVSNQTIPCTEWPSPKELINHLNKIYEL